MGRNALETPFETFCLETLLETEKPLETHVSELFQSVETRNKIHSGCQSCFVVISSNSQLLSDIVGFCA